MPHLFEPFWLVREGLLAEGDAIADSVYEFVLFYAVRSPFSQI
jgi:hypothetical protein